jgi:predicted Zn finger-like uncharacterized protein
MDVRCERCQTEYDFDDALVSDRGTTVKCTNCGHQFKVFPAAGAARPEIWVVRSVSGGELTYTSLGDLQRAIAQGQVTPDDLLLPKGLPPRPLRSIAELDPFFGSHRPASGGKRTLAGVAPPAAAAAGYEPVAPPPVAAARPEPFAPSRSDRPPRPEAEPERPRATTAPKLPPFDPRSASSPPRTASGQPSCGRGSSHGSPRPPPPRGASRHRARPRSPVRVAVTPGPAPRQRRWPSGPRPPVRAQRRRGPAPVVRRPRRARSQTPSSSRRSPRTHHARQRRQRSTAARPPRARRRSGWPPRRSPRRSAAQGGTSALRRRPRRWSHRCGRWTRARLRRCRSRRSPIPCPAGATAGLARDRARCGAAGSSPRPGLRARGVLHAGAA